jgi:hypothetical protein
MQHIELAAVPIDTTFRIVFNLPSTINDSAIGTRAALQATTAPISNTATGSQIQTAIRAVLGYSAYGQFGNVESSHQFLSYFSSHGAINREPIVLVDASDPLGFTIQFGSQVGSPTPYNTWVGGLPLVSIIAP